MTIDNALDASKSRIDKVRSFKAAIINEFNRETFEEFIQVLRESANQLYKISIVGQDAYNHKFELFISSFEYQPFNGCVSLTINYKWSKSSDKPSNWHKEELLLSSGRYQDYKRDANRIYKKDKADDVKPVNNTFERWKEAYPVTYEILFNLFYRWSQACTNRNGYDKIEHLWEYHKSSMGRWKMTDTNVAKNVLRYEILNMYFSRPGRKLSFQAEFEYMNGLGEIAKTKLTTDFIEADTLYYIESEALDYFATKAIGKSAADKEDKPHDDAVDAISYTVSSGRRTGKYLTSIIVGMIQRKLIEENDISVGDFEGVVDAFTFEYYGVTLKAYVKSIGYVTAEDHPGSTEKKIELHDLIVCVDDQGAKFDIRIDSVPYHGIHFDIRRGSLTDAITGVHVSKHSNEWVIYRIRRQERLGKAVDLHYLPPKTPVAYNSKDVEFCTNFYNYLNEKETKEMKKDENKIIINHNAVIVYIGSSKAVVRVIDKKTKEETGSWNTKAGVIMAIAKVFGIGTHMYKMYEVLNTINKPTNKTLDFVADEIRLNGKRIKNYKWYKEAINTKRPEPGKQVEIIME
ncbi:MAG: hypothetical protein E7211_18960 [Clostridium lundense]|jgi:hypothetical protein|nr:hypothetical protein [Clostridium lundense]